MSEPLARLYDLALRTLDEQERRADALRGRLGPVLAAAALGASLLSAPLTGDARPASTAGRLALVVAVAGLLATVASALYLLSPGRHFRVRRDAHRLATTLARLNALDDPASFYRVMIEWLSKDADLVLVELDELTGAFTAMLCGVLVMLCGLTIATLVG